MRPSIYQPARPAAYFGIAVGLGITWLWGSLAFAEQATPHAEVASYTQLVANHFNRVLEIGTDQYGDDKNAMWLASIDLRRGGQNESITEQSRRVYRRIHAPRGSNLYWDVPLVAAAYTLSERTGDLRASQGTDACIDAFFQRCVSDQNGLFLWGNHIWYQVFDDEIQRIGHTSFEARPIPVPWMAFYSRDKQKTATCIRAMGEYHIVDKETGFFDRHAYADRKVQNHTEEKIASYYPFIETGGVLVESLCWLAQQDPADRDELIELAKRVAQYSADHHGKKTGIVRNQGHRDRWDYHYGTTEVGLWAGCLLQASELSGDQAFAESAEPGLLAYLKYGWDDSAQKYYGAVSVDEGTPQPAQSGDDPYPYQPDYHSDVWEPLFPIHDYPMAMAEACITFYEKNGKQEYKQAVDRFVTHIQSSMPARHLSERHGEQWVEGAYADDYGRCIHFLNRASRVFDNPEYRKLAQQVADEAVEQLYIPELGVFRSHPGEDVADSVDGLGTLFLALMELESGQQGDYQGFHF